MNSHAILNGISNESAPAVTASKPRPKRSSSPPLPFRLTAHLVDEETANRQAELFYLQKQIQSQTPMVIVMEDGEELAGCIEWYDRLTLKIRGRFKTLVYKTAIKYMYKAGDAGQ